MSNMWVFVFFHCLLTSLLHFYSFRVPVYLVELFQQYSGITGEGHGNPLQYSCLENPMHRGAWWAAVHRVAQSWTRLKPLSMHACIGEGNGNPLQCSCLESPRDGGAWWAAVYGVAQSRTRLKQLSSSSFLYGLTLTSTHDYWKNQRFD